MFSTANPTINSSFLFTQKDDGPVSNIFVTVDPREIGNWHSHSLSNNDVWIVEQANQSGLAISAFLLLSQFGPNPKLIVDFVGRHLVRTILESVNKLGQLIGGNKNLDEQIGQLLDEAFVRIDEKVWESIQERLIGEGESANGNGGEAKDWMSSGCSAILGLFLNHRLFVANLGNQIAIFCRDGEDAISAISLNECQDKAAHCFGNFDAKLDSISSVHPSIHPQIELDHNARFLLFASPQVWRLFQRICPENQSLDGALANAVAQSIYDDRNGRSPEERIHELLSKLAKSIVQTIDLNQQTISLAIVDLRLDIFPKMDFSNNEDEGGGQMEEDEVNREEREKRVKSAVDWSEFETHHLKEEVMAKVDSIRQMYEQRRNLGSIHED